ncbi:thiol-disulfide isomerase/thioredoxin [Marinilabilia salmonicolor]|jgi:thiol-disulfide isomerase/thioredoxin|uniref:thioredoxin-like domain-containing protein n=1 Tax=Marinilabilia salmonicolor TaxID=989 RepID=UPI000D04D965|nr:thioredoxin-like domain-containing protein [Marinilabilia salmonicolor]PRY93837.1 thiol-disulfide isomerase/thioredoxin [Marinilabilia salmonicolor]
MKNLTVLIFLFISVIGIAQQPANNGHKIEVNIPAFSDTTLILGYYYNQSIHVQDTSYFDNKGTALFEGEEALPQGLYVIYLPNQKYFDLMIDADQHFSLTADTADMVKSLDIRGADVTNKFNDYQRFIMARQEEANNLQQKLQTAAPDSEEATQIKDQLTAVNEKVQNKWEELQQENQGSMLGVFIKGMQEIEVLRFDIDDSVQKKDSVQRVKRFYYYKNHYFDNMPLDDERLLRTPFFAKKVEQYFSSVIPQVPDTLLNESIKVIEQARPAPKMFNFLVSYLFNYANESEYMGMDKMMVGLAEKYYLSGEATWADEEFLSKLETRVKELKPTLIGNLSHDLKMQAYTGEYHRLHEIVAPATILVFWETDCGHCKKAIPQLHDLYQDQLRDLGVKVFAVYTQGDQPEWTEFIEEHELYDFINVWDPNRQSGFRENYDIRSTPTVFVLGEDKKIIGKRISIEDLPGFIERYLNQ